MSQQQQQQQPPFGFQQQQQRGYPPHLMQQQPGLQQQPPHNIPQQIQIPNAAQSQRYMSGGMPSPSLAQPTSMGGYPGASGSVVGSNPNVQMPFGPPVRPVDQAAKSHHDILRKHNEEYASKQTAANAVNQAQALTPGTYVPVPKAKHNNTIIPVLPRPVNPYPASE
ncbi:hypothetical protein BGZ96_006705 [Linnemannia gamsii]|uniref:Uncharacterized protein n=1 Tax=Linnemannia gamsii TaxID=64522 RepID=A0ABQ7K2P4_9FUNG|nr:hypothetical protein BGZ96_006705 [Linnemannia gamsii]